MEKINITKLRIKTDASIRSFLNHLVYGQTTSIDTGANLSPEGINVPEAFGKELKKVESSLKIAVSSGITANSYNTYRKNLE